MNLVETVCQIVGNHAASLFRGIQTRNHTLNVARQFTAGAAEVQVIGVRGLAAIGQAIGSAGYLLL